MNYNGVSKNTIIGFMLFIFSSFSYASDNNSVDYRFEHLKISDGLPSSRVHKTFQQSNGFIWFATDAGASRYDGKNFEHYQYNLNGINHISNNYVNDIIEDGNGNIWIATELGINVISTSGTITSYFRNDNILNSLPSNLIHDLFKDSNDIIWVATENGLVTFKETENSFIKYNFENDDLINVYNINESNSKIYFGSENGLFYINSSDLTNRTIKKVKKDNFDNILNEIINTSHKDKKGNLWFGTDRKGFFTLNPFDNSIKIYDFNKNNKIQSISQINNNIYIGHGDQGITVYSQDNGIIKHLTSSKDDYSILSNRIEDIYIDQSNVLWISTRKGVSYYSSLKNGSHIYQVKEKGSNINKKIYSLTKYKDSIVVATSGWIKSFNITDITFKNMNKSPTDNNLNAWTVNSDKHNNLWIAHDNGITVYNHITKKVDHYLNHIGNKFDLPNNPFYTILPIDNETAWITGYESVGVILFHREKGILKQYLNKKDNPYRNGGNYTITKTIDNFGNLWLATTNGVVKITANSNKVFFYNNNMENLRITGMSIDKENTLWATTSEMGLLKITNINEEKVTIENIGKKDGIPDLKLKNVIVDNGHLWLTSNNKLFKYNITENKFKQFPSLITDLNLVFFEGSLRKYNDNIFVGSNKGLVRFEKSKIKLNSFNPNIHITNISNGNKDISHLINSNKPKFSYNNNNISFKFSVTDYTFPENNLIKYKLENFDEDWISAKNVHNASYTNLDAGEYTFKIRGSNSDGVWSEKEATFNFKVKEAWWVYALFAMGFFLIVILVMFFYSRHKQIKTLKVRANYDSLTHIPNRFNFTLSLNKLIKQENCSFLVIFIDLDDFKEINDSMGHAIGDELICLVASRLNSNLNDNEFVCRLGGDEFAILINNINTINIDSRINEIHELLNENYFLNGKIIKGSASVGIAICPENGSDDSTLLKNADIAMYESKKNGKNNVSYFNQKMNDDFNEKTEIRNLLHSAIYNNEFSVYFQPKVCVKTEGIIGLEALIRWIHPEKGFISPAVFIPESENNGTIIKIGEWILRESCKQAALWNKKGLLQGSVSVNMSPVQFHHPDIINVVFNALKDFNLPANKLEIEITESVLVDNVELTLNVFKQLRELGVKIALDDFGTGYSSLSYLMEFPIDTLKIDRAFVKDIKENPKTEIVIKNIFNLADDLDFSVVVEGVETREQLEIVTQHKCDLIQGYLFSPPVNISKTTLLLEESIRIKEETLKKIMA